MIVKTLNSILVTGVISISMLSSCSKDDDNQTIDTKTQIESKVSSGTWKVTYFFDSGIDQTNTFSDYTFSFLANGTLTASNSANTYNGTWSISDKNSSDDSADDLDFNISFNLTNGFEDLNDDWDITSQSASKVELIDISGGNGGTDYLTFEKK